MIMNSEWSVDGKNGNLKGAADGHPNVRLRLTVESSSYKSTLDVAQVLGRRMLLRG